MLVFLRSGDGASGKGCIVAPGVAEFHCRRALPCSDMMAPNLLELEMLSQMAVADVADAVQAARALIAKGPRLVLVKHLARAGYHADCFEMLLVTADEAAHQPAAGGLRRASAGRRRRFDQRSAAGGSAEGRGAG